MKTEVFPRQSDKDGEQNKIRIAKPAYRFSAQEAHNRVDETTVWVGVVEQHPHDRDINFGKHIGEEKNRTKNAAPWQVASHHDSQCQRQGQLQSEREGYNQTYVAERFQKHLIREDVFKVFQPYVIHRRSQAIPIE